MRIELLGIPGSRGDKDIFVGEAGRASKRWGSVVRSGHGRYRLKDASGNEVGLSIKPGDPQSLHGLVGYAIGTDRLRDPDVLAREARERRLKVREAFAQAEREEQQTMELRAARVVTGFKQYQKQVRAGSCVDQSDITLQRMVVDAMRWAQNI
ncbi:hypothetical protein [Bradyrhizobium sp. Ec3.3]|uniref:hypothetical protein n=1 Tax=Bradyrhizobium sp. Ec3.3 TaxID=189753 RepID=UPI000481EEDF|nr:hypothetical protein [Bradyrhizobium sp. Ec3.3]